MTESLLASGDGTRDHQRMQGDQQQQSTGIPTARQPVARQTRLAFRVSSALSNVMLTALALLPALSLDPLASRPLPETSMSAIKNGPTVAASAPEATGLLPDWTAHAPADTVPPVVRTRSTHTIEIKAPATLSKAGKKAAPVTPPAVTEPPPAAASPPPPATAEPPSWSEAEIEAALKTCLATVAPMMVELQPRPALKDDACGLPAPVAISRIGTDRVEIRPAVVVNCAMARALHTWLEDVAQPAARQTLGSPIVRLAGTEGYVCRNRNGAATGPISEHAFGNAIDISAFVLADGRTIDVLKHWGAGVTAALSAAAAAPAKSDANKSAGTRIASARSNLGGPAAVPAAASGAASPAAASELAFLRRVHGGACTHFGTVLGPDANEAHRNHLHFDLKARKRKAFCE